VIGRGGRWLGRQKANEALVDLGFPDEFRAGQSADAGCEGMRVGAAAVDEIGDSAPAELANGGVSGEAARQVT
jgi:hypothetical protein